MDSFTILEFYSSQI